MQFGVHRVGFGGYGYLTMLLILLFSYQGSWIFLYCLLLWLILRLYYFTSFIFTGGPIQKVVLEKTGTRYARSATIINEIYAAVLYYFKALNDLPMSTTWVLVGLLR